MRGTREFEKLKANMKKVQTKILNLILSHYMKFTKEK